MSVEVVPYSNQTEVGEPFGFTRPVTVALLDVANDIEDVIAEGANKVGLSSIGEESSSQLPINRITHVMVSTFHNCFGIMGWLSSSSMQFISD